MTKFRGFHKDLDDLDERDQVEASFLSQVQHMRDHVDCFHKVEGSFLSQVLHEIDWVEG